MSGIGEHLGGGWKKEEDRRLSASGYEPSRGVLGKRGVLGEVMNWLWWVGARRLWVKITYGCEEPPQ